MSYPEWDEDGDDEALIEEFYRELVIRFQELKQNIEYNEGLLHIDMADFRIRVEKLCKERRLGELSECFSWLNSIFCRSENRLLNAINVSFLEYFNYQKGLTKNEFKATMPKELYRGYVEMMEYMENMAREIDERNKDN